MNDVEIRAAEPIVWRRAVYESSPYICLSLRILISWFNLNVAISLLRASCYLRRRRRDRDTAVRARAPPSLAAAAPSGGRRRQAPQRRANLGSGDLTQISTNRNNESALSQSMESRGERAEMKFFIESKMRRTRIDYFSIIGGAGKRENYEKMWSFMENSAWVQHAPLNVPLRPAPMISQT